MLIIYMIQVFGNKMLHFSHFLRENQKKKKFFFSYHLTFATKTIWNYTYDELLK